MEVLYHSKGISKTAMMRKIISIVICLLLMIGLLSYAGSSVKGETHNISFGGRATRVSFDEYRFSSDEREGISIIGFVFGIMAIIDATILGLSRKSWTEIRKDVIKGNFMGKTVSHSVADITKVSVYNSYLILTGKFGKAGLVVENPSAARKVIDELLLNR